MDYLLLAGVYDSLSHTSKRLEKTAIMADFLKGVLADELEMVVLLLQGRVFPLWDKRVLGLSEKLLIKAIAIASGASEKKIIDSWRQIGDIGRVAETLLANKTQATLFSEDLTVQKVFDTLRKVASSEGKGAMDAKAKLVAQLLSSAKGVEACYIVRSAIGDLRVGIAEGTLRDAIGLAFLVNSYEYDSEANALSWEGKTQLLSFPELQSALDRANDFAVVAKIAKEKGATGLQEVKIVPGKPLKVMLAQKVLDFAEGFKKVGLPCAIEYKFDGFRCITGSTPIYTYEKGLLSVKDVTEGLHVLTHKGNFKKVIANQQRVIDKGESVFRMQSWLGHEFRITAGHELLVMRNNEKKWLPIESVCKSDSLFFPFPKKSFPSPFSKKLVLKDGAGYEKSIPINNFFFRFLGYWLGDGFTNEFHHTERVGLVFNKKHRALCDTFRNGLSKYFRITDLSEYDHGGAVSLYWRDKPLRVWLSTHFRREWKGKHVPWWFHGISSAQFKYFLKGWIEADGHVDKKGRTSITTKERDVAMSAQLLGLRHNVMIAVKKFRVKDTTYYRLVLCKRPRNYSWLADGVAVGILKHEKIKYPDPRIKVYNLQVEGDESYCTTLLTLHNCQIHKTHENVQIFTRRLENVTNQFPDIVKVVNEHVKGDEFIIDAEAVGYDSATKKYRPFQDISQRIRRKYDIHELEKTLPVELAVFDVLYFEGKDFLDAPFTERRAFVADMFTEAPQKIVLAPQLVTSDLVQAEKFYKESLEAGNEGVMLKKLDAPYQPGSRVGTMIKLKPIMDTLDLAIVGAEWGTGKRSGWLTSYTVACRDDMTDELVTIGKFGTGIKEKEEAAEGDAITFEEMTERLKPLVQSTNGREVMLKPDVVVEVKFEEIQKSPSYSSGYALRFPRFVKLRDDRGLEDMTTLSLVESSYEQQRGRN